MDRLLPKRLLAMDAFRPGSKVKGSQCTIIIAVAPFKICGSQALRLVAHASVLARHLDVL